MTEHRLDQELQELLYPLQVKMEPSPIAVVCLYHKADKREWQRLDQHLEALSWQLRQYLQGGTEIVWKIYEYDPDDILQAPLLAESLAALANAHVALIGLSVDMQLLLIQNQELYNTIQGKLEQVKRHRKGVWTYVAGIRLKDVLWDEHLFERMDLLPKEALCGHSKKDSLCIEIADKVRRELKEIIAYMQRSTPSSEEEA